MFEVQTTLRRNAAEIWSPLTQQRVFRRLMEAFAYPGRIRVLCKEGCDDALRAVLATLADAGTGLADPAGLLAADDWRRLAARRVPPEHAAFVVLRGDAVADFQPALGTLESPEGGATLVLRVATLGQGSRLRLNGPGIDGESVLEVTGLNAAWLRRREAWNSGFPMGVDLLLVDDRHVAALPRAIRIRNTGEQ